MSKNRTVGLVVDATYLYAAKALIGGNVNYNHLVDVVHGMGNRMHSVCHVRANPGQRKFLSALKSRAFKVFSSSDNSSSPAWVSDVADSIMSLARLVDHLVIAVGDNRYAPVIEWAMNTWGCTVTLVGFESLLEQDLADLLAGDDDVNFLAITDDFVYAAEQHAS